MIQIMLPVRLRKSSLVLLSLMAAHAAGCAREKPADAVAPDSQSSGVAASGQAKPETALRAPFDLASGRPVVMMSVNGKGPYPFVFDTGAPGLLLMKSLADELALESVGVARVNSPAGGEPVEMNVVRIESIDVGGASAHDVRAQVMDFGDGRLGAGVVGPAMFRDYGRVALDFAANQLIIGGDVEGADGARWIAFGPSAPLLDADIVIGEISMPAHIDTGAPHVLSVPHSYADRLPLAGPVTVIGMARTIDREFEIKSAPIAASARLGDAEIPLTDIRFFDIPFANLGSGGLRGLMLEIDWTGERFRLDGVATPVEPPPARVRVERPAAE